MFNLCFRPLISSLFGLKKIIDLYIDSSVAVALSTAALCYVTGWYFGVVPPAYLTGCLFCGTVVGYNFIKYAPLASDFISVRGAYLKRMQLFSGVNFLIAAYLLTKFSFEALLCTSVIGALVFFYVFPVHRFKGSIRNIKGLKVYVVALVWALSTVLLPVIETEVSVNGEVLLEAFRRALFILAITIPFEIRDLDLDQPGLHTLPQQYGVRGARLIGYICLATFWILGIWMGSENDGVTWLKEGVLVIVSWILLAGAGRSQHSFYSGLVVESLPVFWWVLLWLF